MPGLSQWTRDVVGLILNGTIKSIDHRDAFGRTALHYAANIGDATLVDFLLQNGANPNVTNQEGFTPLMQATSRTRYFTRTSSEQKKDCGI